MNSNRASRDTRPMLSDWGSSGFRLRMRAIIGGRPEWLDFPRRRSGVVFATSGAHKKKAPVAGIRPGHVRAVPAQGVDRCCPTEREYLESVTLPTLRNYLDLCLSTTRAGKFF